MFTDPQSRQLVFRSVLEYYNAFTDTLLGLPTDRPYGTDVANTFYNNLERSIQEIMIQRRFTFPPQLPNETNALARRLQVRNFPARNTNINTPHAFLTLGVPTACDDADGTYVDMLAYQGVTEDEDPPNGLADPPFASHQRRHDTS